MKPSADARRRALTTCETLSDAQKRAFRQALLAWYRREARDLPWRATRDPYRIWLSEVMLQQTQVRTVIPYYERFVAAFPAVDDLAAAPLDDVLKLWEGLGYYTRAGNLHKAAKIVAAERAGAFPQHAEEWETLPGVGRYTAAAIASIAQGARTAVVDGNVKRVLARVCAIHASIDAAETEERLWAIASELLAPRAPGDFNQAMMELGARVCTPRKPTCLTCPVNGLCAANAQSLQDALPKRDKRSAAPVAYAAAALIARRGRWLLVKRPERGLLGGMWELPGVEMGAEKPTARELAEAVRASVGLDVEVGGLLATVTHVYSHRRLTLTAYACRVVGGRVRSADGRETIWARPTEIASLALGKVYHKVFARIDRDDLTTTS